MRHNVNKSEALPPAAVVMGDRTWFTVRLPAVEVEAFVSRHGPPDESRQGRGLTQLSYFDTSTAFMEDIREEARSGLEFIGSHGGGDEYGPYTFYTRSRAVALWPSGDLFDGWVLPHPDASSFVGELRALREFLHDLATLQQRLVNGGGLYMPYGLTENHRATQALQIINDHLASFGADDVGGHRAYTQKQWVKQGWLCCHDCMLVITHGSGGHGPHLSFNKAYALDTIARFRQLCDALSAEGFSLEEPASGGEYTGVHDVRGAA